MSPKPHPLSRRQALVTGGAALAGTAVMAGKHSPARAQVPQAGPARPGFYRFKLGDFEITSLLDGFVQVDGPHPIFGENQPAEAVQNFAEENFLPRTRMEISFAPILVNTGKETVLFDTGNGAGRRPGTGDLVNQLNASGIKPEQVTIVVLTHFHGDHIGGLLTNGQLTFPNARYFAGEAEFAAWTSPALASGQAAQNAKLVQDVVVPLKDRTTFVKPEDEVVPGIRAINAYGHTPGMLAFRIESQGKQVINWTDTTNHPVMSLARPDWHVRFDMDKAAAAMTRKRLLDMTAADRIAVTGYHMPFPAFGYVEKKNNAYRWVQASYQLNI